MSKAKRVLVLPDLHFPDQDEAALSCVLQTAALWKPDEIVVLGDWLDAGAFSTHPKMSLQETSSDFLVDEVGPCNDLLDILQKNGEKLVYIEGNHEFRVERFATQHREKELYKLLSPKRLISNRADENGEFQGKRKNFKWIPYIPGSDIYSHYKIARDLIAVHGWSYAKNVAQVHLDKAKTCSVVFGHCHRKQMVMTREALTGKYHKAWSPGCLSKLIPVWNASSPNEWANGFSMIYVGSKSWSDYDVLIDKGYCVLPDGKEVKA